jgi:hypothetical protein
MKLFVVGCALLGCLSGLVYCLLTARESAITKPEKGLYYFAMTWLLLGGIIAIIMGIGGAW